MLSRAHRIFSKINHVLGHKTSLNKFRKTEIIIKNLFLCSLVAQTVKNLSAMQETQVPPLGQEDTLGKGMATHSSILAWRTPWKRSLAGYSPQDHKELDLTERLTLSRFSYHDTVGLEINYEKKLQITQVHAS